MRGGVFKTVCSPSALDGIPKIASGNNRFANFQNARLTSPPVKQVPCEVQNPTDIVYS